MSYLQVKNVVKSFGNNKVLENISIDFEKGEMAGYGRATKKQVIEMVMRMMNITRKIDPDENNRRYIPG